MSAEDRAAQRRIPDDQFNEILRVIRETVREEMRAEREAMKEPRLMADRSQGQYGLIQAVRVFTCTDHAGHWVGVASVVVAEDEEVARAALDKELASAGLKPFASEPYTLTEISLNEPKAYVLCDGDY